MKAFTDINQSKKLEEILPLESADMCYQKVHAKQEYFNIAINVPPENQNDLPCWSLAALLSVLPKGINISTPKPVNELDYCCWNQYDEIYASNPIDACYEMVIKLHEQKLL